MTTWKSKRKEPFADGKTERSDAAAASLSASSSASSSPSAYPVHEFDGEHDERTMDLGNRADELILMESSAQAEPDQNKDEKPDDTQKQPQQPSLEERWRDLFRNFNLYKAKVAFKELVQLLPQGADKLLDYFAAGLVGRAMENPTGPAGRQAKETVKRQFARFVAIPLSFVVILNWWHVWNYTDFTFNWKSVLEFPLFRVIYYVLEPVCTVFEFVNYYLLNIRMDADVDPRWREAMRSVWDYRPLSFTALYLVVAGTLVSSPVGKWIVDVLTGGGGLFWAVLPASIFAFFYLNMNVVRLAMFQFYFGHILVVVFALLLMLLFTMMFANVLTPFYVIYMLVLSYFSLPLFQGTNTFAKVSEIFSDLREAPVEGDPQSLWNFLFRNCFGIFMVVSVLLPLLSYHFVELGRINPSPRLASAMTLINVAFLILLSIPFWGTLNEFRSVIVKALGAWLGLKGFSDHAEVNEADIQL